MSTKRSCRRGEDVVCLIDGTALAYRSFYAFIRRPLINSRGENVSAVYGFASSLLKLLKELDPSHIAVVFDRPEPTFRHEAYAEYKATRPEMPDEMAEQLPAIRQLVEVFGIPVLSQAGYEADDVIGTLVREATAAGLRSVIVSGDKDFFQLVDDHVTVLDPMKDIEYTPEKVEETFGVPPAQVPDVLGLMGDTSDNVPGVPGIGQKTAVDLISRFGTIEDVLESIDQIGGAKRRENLASNREAALMSRDLVRIDTQAPVPFDEKTLRRSGLDTARARAFLSEHEFPSLLKMLPAEDAPDASGYRLVRTEAELGDLVKFLKSSGGFALDTETDSLDPLTAALVGLSFAVDGRGAYYVPVGHASGAPLKLKSVLKKLAPVLEDPGVPKYGQNIKFDYEVLASNGVHVSPLSFDTMVASYLLDPGRRQHNLSALALEYLGVGMTPIERLIGKGAEQLTFADVDVEPARDYACADADVTLRLARLLSDRLKEEGLQSLMDEVEMPLVRVLAGMELAGIELDTSILRELSDRLGGEIENLRAKICELAGTEFNLDSPKQVGSVLFEKLELPRGRRTKTGYSTDISVLERLREVHEVPGLILDYRQLQKLKSGYLDALPGLVNPDTGRVHTSFNQTVASTGRLSSSNPNLQNIPIRTELGREIRKAFVAAEGHTLLSADYSQIELRIMAHLSGDPGLISAFRQGLDVHRSTAAQMFQIPEEDVTPSQRDRAKTINFGIMYGMGRFGLARRLDISTEEAADFIDRYFETYPGVADYTAAVIRDAAERGYASTMLGRKRPITGLDSDNMRVRSVAERIAVNTPIQGSAADLIKLAMIVIDGRIRSDELPARMVLQVHDELVFEVENGAEREIGDLVTREMEHPERLSFDVPIVANLAWGSNWFEAHA